MHLHWHHQQRKPEYLSLRSPLRSSQINHKKFPHFEFINSVLHTTLLGDCYLKNIDKN